MLATLLLPLPTTATSMTRTASSGSPERLREVENSVNPAACVAGARPRTAVYRALDDGRKVFTARSDAPVYAVAGGKPFTVFETHRYPVRLALG